MTESPTPLYGDLVGDALAYAAGVHSHQTRKGKSEPYLSHLLKVCSLVIHYGGNEDQIIAAALHDAVEDQGGEPRAEEIGRRFGDAVERIVRDCSDSLVRAGQEKPPWKKRKQAYLERLEAPDVNDSRLVEACDKLANLQDIVEDVENDRSGSFLDRFSGGPDGVLWYYGELEERLIGSFPQLRSEYAELFGRLANSQRVDST